MRKNSRIRIYKNNDKFIKLERKEVWYSYIYKESAPLTREEVEKNPGRGTVRSFLYSSHSLCREFYIGMYLQYDAAKDHCGLRTVPWILDAGTVRITSDSDVRAAIGSYDIFDPGLPALSVLEPGKPDSGSEVYRNASPAFTRCSATRQQAEFTAISKYVLCYEKTRYMNGFRVLV